MLRNSPIPSATNATTSNDMLDRAFQKTYGLKLKDLFRTLDLSLGTYRYSVSTMLPNVTKIAWSLKSKEIQTRAWRREAFSFVVVDNGSARIVTILGYPTDCIAQLG
jgi:hypothetical protein